MCMYWLILQALLQTIHVSVAINNIIINNIDDKYVSLMYYACMLPESCSVWLWLNKRSSLFATITIGADKICGCFKYPNWTKSHGSTNSWPAETFQVALSIPRKSSLISSKSVPFSRACRNRCGSSCWASALLQPAYGTPGCWLIENDDTFGLPLVWFKPCKLQISINNLI